LKTTFHDIVDCDHCASQFRHSYC